MHSDGQSGKSNYKAEVEQHTGIEKTVPKKHQEYLTALEEVSNWPQTQEYFKHIPPGYEFKGYPKGGNTTGLVFKKGEHSEIVFKKGDISKNPAQHNDYVSYTIYGNKLVARNGDLIFKRGTTIVRQDAKTQIITPIPQEELTRLGVVKPEAHPDIHIPVQEFIKKFGEK